MVHGQPSEDSKKNPTIYQFPLLVTGIWNVSAFKPPLIPWEENYVLIPNSNLYSICAVVFKVKKCIFKIRKIQKKIANLKLSSTLETYLKMLKTACYQRKTFVEVEPLTFISILTIWFNTFTKIIENRITALLLEFTFRFHFLAFTINR